MKRVCRLRIKIYWETLCITRHDRTEYITMGPGGLDDAQVCTFSSSPQYTGRTALSWNLLTCILVEGRIPCSFTNFITTPELSGPELGSGQNRKIFKMSLSITGRISQIQAGSLS